MPRGRDLLIAAALAGIVVALYAPRVRHFEFVSYDDNEFITANPHVQEGLSARTLRWSLTSVVAANWHPVTMLTHLLDVELFGLNAGGHHLTNVVIHAANAALLYALLRMLFPSAVWRSALVAALFAVHPLRVESVAWVAERKDVLCALFFFLTLMAYVQYARAERPVPRRAWFAASTGLLALGLMSKAMLVTVPGVLMLLDYWPLARLSDAGERRRRLLEKLPFVALAFAVSAVTFAVQQTTGAVRSLDSVPFPMRLQNAIVAYVVYLWKTIAPTRLSVLYPYEPGIPPLAVVGAVLLLATITWLTWRQRTRRPYLIVGWLWYLGMMVPVIGIVQVGQQAYADRYTYLPLIGPTLAVTWVAADWAGRSAARVRVASVAACVVLALLAWRTIDHLPVWRNSQALWTHAARVTRDNWVAWNHLATVYANQGRLDEALRLTQAVVDLRPHWPLGQFNRGNTLMKAGDAPAAQQAYRRALEARPDFAAAHNNLALLLIADGRTSEAIEHFRAAAEAEPHVADWRRNLAAAQRRLEQERVPATRPSSQ